MHHEYGQYTPNDSLLILKNQIQHYQKRISGPILDRIDIKVHVPYLGNQKILEQFNIHVPKQAEIISPFTYQSLKKSIQ